MAYGYDQGQPFGDPSKFTRSTGEDEINRFNEWMRSQPWWQAARGTSGGDFSEGQRHQLEATLRAQGIALPKDFHIDEGGNFNQKSRVKRNVLIGAGLAGAALTGGAALGAFGGAGAAGAGGAAAGGAGAGGTLASTTIGSGFIPAITGGTGLGALGGGAAAAGGLGGTVAATEGTKHVIDQVKDKTKSTGGSDVTDFLKDLGYNATGNLLNGFGASLFDQHLNSYKGTAADPVQTLAGVQRRISNAADPLAARAFGSHDVPDATATMTMPSYSGGALPMTFGVQRPAHAEAGNPDDDMEHLKASLRVLGMKV